MPGLDANCTTTADEEKAIEILQKVKIKLVNNIKRYALLQFLVFHVGTMFGDSVHQQWENRKQSCSISQGTEKSTTSAVAMVTAVGFLVGGAFEMFSWLINGS